MSLWIDQNSIPSLWSSDSLTMSKRVSLHHEIVLGKPLGPGGGKVTVVF